MEINDIEFSWDQIQRCILQREVELEQIKRQDNTLTQLQRQEHIESLLNSILKLQRLGSIAIRQPEIANGDGCGFLERLPLEVRERIYRIMFQRPLPIVPGMIRRDSSVRLYKYSWDTGMGWVELCSYGLPKYGSYIAEPKRVQYFTKPTIEQLAIVEKSDTEALTNFKDVIRVLPKFWNEELGAWVTPYIERRGGFAVRICNVAHVAIRGIFGVAALRSCKKVRDEALEILYGENTFVLDARVETHTVPVHEMYMRGKFDELERLKRRIPGAVADKMDEIFEDLFSSDLKNFITRKDTRNDAGRYISFFDRIGAGNTSKIKSIVVQAFFRSSYRLNPESTYRFGKGIADNLPIFMTILKRVCPSMRRITIRQAIYDGHFSSYDTSKIVSKPMSNFVTNGVIEKIVEGFPGLQSLSLSHDLDPFRFVPDEEKVLQWGDAYRWEEFVERRFEASKQVDNVGEEVSRDELVNYLSQRK